MDIRHHEKGGHDEGPKMTKRWCMACGRELDAPTYPGRPTTVCSEACRVQRKNIQREQSRQRAVKRGCPPHRHGTVTGYNEYGCRCDVCKKWARDYKAGRRSIAAATAAGGTHS